MNAKNLTRSALLIALALALSYMERFIPLQLLIPLPGIKLGLANIVSLMALYFLSPAQGFTILLIRCLLGSIVTGTLSGLAMSLTGGILAYGVMGLSRHIPVFSVYGVSILGAAAHNLGQIIAAAAMMKSLYTFYYLPFLLLSGIATGLLTGAVSSVTFQALERLPGRAKEGAYSGRT